MNTSPNNASNNQEIDLSQISKGIGNFFENIATFVFRAILFFKRNIVVLGILLIIGILIGFYLDRSTKSYDNQIIVSPNYDSNNYLYEKIKLINSKIIDRDTLFLKNKVGILNPKKFKKIEIKPINGVYKFIDDRKDNFELIKLMAEDGDIQKVISDEVTSKNYPFHEIKFVTSGVTSDEESVEPLLNYLNDSKYYTEIQKAYVNNLKVKIIANDSIISQIDGILERFSSKINNTTNEKLIYYNENTQLNDIIKTKEELVDEQGSNRVQLVNLDKIIKDRSYTINVKNTSSVNGKMKFIIPILFIILFVLGGVFKSFYKRQLAKSKL